MKWIKLFLALFLMPLFNFAWADITVTMQWVMKENEGKPAGTVTMKQTRWGVLFEPDLKGLTPGLHGFHVHQNPNCADEGMEAGGHLDPAKTEKHLGPFNERGHLGDVAALIVKNDGTATLPVLAPKLKLSDLYNHSLIIHKFGDNYSDNPEKLGGGGPRIACAVIPVPEKSDGAVTTQ